MSYFQFLAIFLVLPLALMAWLTISDLRQGRQLPGALGNLPYWLPLIVHVFIAVTYTTPWDNYLVATGVWYYNPELVTGITLGWVPIEEYTFFVLQTLLTGLWLLFLARRISEGRENLPNGTSLRWWSTALLGVAWLASVGLLVSGWEPGTYLGLILGWALPPIMLQTAFGADLLWRHRRLVGLTLTSVTLYLSAADTLAIGEWGTWTIDPGQSLNIFVAGLLPVEELIFFLMTNILIVFGMTLALELESRLRVRALWKFLRIRWGRKDRPSNDLPLAVGDRLPAKQRRRTTME